MAAEDIPADGPHAQADPAAASNSNAAPKVCGTQEELVLRTESTFDRSPLAPAGAKGPSPSRASTPSNPSDLPFNGLEAERRIL